MENAPEAHDLPQAVRIDYAPPPPGSGGRWWRVIVVVFCTICLAIGSGSLAAAAITRSSSDQPILLGIGIGFLAATLGLPLMIFVAKRL